MKLGCKISPHLLFSNDSYREHILKFDVLYVNSDWLKDMEVMDRIYRFINDNGKEQYFYYLLSSRWNFPRLYDTTLGDMRGYAHSMIKRYPNIKYWEICHEDIDNDGKQREGNRYYKKLGKKWKEDIYKILKEDFPEKKLFYGDYIRNDEKKNQLISFLNQCEYCDGFNFQLHTDISRPLSQSFIKDIVNKSQKEVVFLETIVWNIKNFVIGEYKSKPFKRIVGDLYKKGSFKALSVKPGVTESLQAYHYKRYKKIVSDIDTIFGLWCLSDAKEDTWNFREYHDKPGILTSDMKEKKAYESIFS